MILSKVDYYEKYKRMYFGNRPRIYPDYTEWYLSKDKPKQYMVRSYEAGGPTYCGVSTYELFCKPTIFSQMAVSEQMDDDRIILQGEYLPPFDLTYSRERLTMKEAFKVWTIRENSPLSRLKVKALMCPEAQEMFDWLIDEHGQDHVLEFSVYDGPVGILGWNTIIWECRRY